LAKKIKEAFAQEYLTPNGRLVSHTQTGYALALSFDLVPENLRKKSAAYFANDVKKFGHLTTGFVGTPLLCSTLSDIGRDDLAFKLLNRKEFPSWLYPVTQGATTIWERWDTQKPDGTIIEGMNSFNHYAYGAIGQWLYEHVAGMKSDIENPGFKHIHFHPHPGGGLTNANAEFKSMYGLVKSAWEIKDGQFVYHVIIPANTTATVTLPHASGKTVNCNSKSIDDLLKFACLAFPLLTICQSSINDKLPARPNILWLVTEDMGPYIAAFGDSTIQTPNLSRLASEGVIYPNLYSTSGVCAPSRAAIATGMYPSSIGANHMRTNSNMDKTGLPAYEAVPPDEVKMISELLRMNGYYCTNNYKQDYQFKRPATAWDESSPYAHWRNREENQPFFSIFNFTETHESGLFEPYGFRHIETRHYHAGDRSYKWEKDLGKNNYYFLWRPRRTIATTEAINL